MNRSMAGLWVAALLVLPWVACAQESPAPPVTSLRIEKIDERQVAALALAGKVWGFLKYHHPAVTSGQRRWDDELLTRLPAIVAARSARDVQVLLVKWIDALGPVDDCKDCAGVDVAPGDIQHSPELGWIADRKQLGEALSERLQRIHRNRVKGQQHYVRLAPNVGNPIFQNEPNYPDAKYPNSGLQIIGVLRFWNAVEYWYPYRDLIVDWDRVLTDTLRHVALPLEPAAWHRELYRLTARIDDGHANVVGKVTPRDPSGPCRLPVSLRVVDGQFVVEQALTDDEAAHRFLPGDVLQALDGRSVGDIVAEARDSYGASNESFRWFAIGRLITNGACGPARVSVMRNEPVTLDVQRVASNAVRILPVYFNDRDGDTFQMLSAEVAYLKLSTIKNEDVPGYLAKLSGVKSLVIDIRNYPSAFVVFTLGQSLVDAPTPFVTFTEASLSNPGMFIFGPPLQMSPAQPHFGGRVAVLVDESSISNAEYTAMALRASPRARLYGRQTAGADGNVSTLGLPGDLGATMTGIGVFNADRTPTQRRGVNLDVECPVTIAGLREGRDEILACALKGLAAQ